MPSIYVITDACVDVKDESCVSVCPVDCIDTTDIDRVSYIDPDECIGCDACLPACPVGAIAVADGRHAAPAEWTALNARWFHDPASVRARIDQLAP